MLLKRLVLFLLVAGAGLSAAPAARANHVLIPMDNTQKECLKAYGVAFWLLQREVPVDWLLNYRGGAFAFETVAGAENELAVRGVNYQVISEAQYTGILQEIADPNANMDVMKLEKVPKIAVYTPKGKQPWDDAVTMVLAYAEIPYTQLYDDEVLKGELPKYDWLHLHHEDFTGQYGKFYASYSGQPWYKKHVQLMENLARINGFDKVSQLKLAVAKKISEYVAGGGFMFAMCSATDTYDIALAADGVDICAEMFDGDGADPNAQSKLDFTKTFAFTDFQIERNPMRYEHSSIDATDSRRVVPEQDYFSLFDFSAKWDPIPTMLTQDHTKTHNYLYESRKL